MLKKLLASVLAVATVATCAYVPSALASAETTYKTANEVEYAVWKLNNPDAAPEATTDLTVYVTGNATQATLDKTNTAAFKGVKLTDNTAEYVKAELAKLANYKDVADTYKYDIVVSATAAANVYVAHVTKSTAVYYYPVSEGVDKTLLGWYVDPTTAVLADMYANVAIPKIAGSVFTNWVYGDVIAPDYREIVKNSPEANYYYTPVTLFRATSGNFVAAELISGTYALKGGNSTELLLPNNDKANWNVYLNNWLKVSAPYNYDVLTKADKDGKSANYEAATIRAIGENKYAVVYTAEAAAADPAKTIKYQLTIDGVMYDANVVTETYNTDVDYVYAAIKNAVDADKNPQEVAFKDYATLADFLAKDKKDLGVVRTVKEVYRTVVNTTAKALLVEITTTPAYKYDVYSFAANDVVVLSNAYLTDEQVKATEYKNIDATTQLVVNKPVVKATVADLGVATEATVKGVPAVYAYAELQAKAAEGVTGLIYTTYKMGDATAALADFATTTGAFDEQAYFCRDAKAGDEVTLKVSLSAQGEAKGFDVAKISVEWNVIGCTAGENYAFAATELYKAGTASQITLAEGTNIVTATVYYNGVKVGTFAPFYAAV